MISERNTSFFKNRVQYKYMAICRQLNGEHIWFFASTQKIEPHEIELAILCDHHLNSTKEKVNYEVVGTDPRDPYWKGD